MKMSEKIDRALFYMLKAAKQGGEWISPTDIGRYVGGIGKHSSYGSPICKKLVECGLVERNEKGHYRLK